jgi:DNA-directed RNA polymerase alpha subunit
MEKPEDVMGKIIDRTLCSTRCYNMLLSAGIQTYGEATRWSGRELKKLPGAGIKSIQELKGILAEHGLSLSQQMSQPSVHDLEYEILVL